jgi:uncharacterized membrane-anchored protein
MGDLLTKPPAKGGYGFGTIGSSARCSAVCRVIVGAAGGPEPIQPAV